MPATTTTARRFTTTLRAASGHTMFIRAIDRADAPANVQRESANWQQLYEVRNFDAEGVVFFYLAKGYRHPESNDRGAHAPRQITAFYRNGSMWSSFGETMQAAVDGAQRDGWLHAR